MENTKGQLFKQMLKVFNEDDIREICFRLSIVYGDLNGQNRRAKTMSLIERCELTNRTANLIALCQELRPAVDWPDVSAGQTDKSDSSTTVLDDEPAQEPPVKPPIKIPVWVWGLVGLLLLALVVLAVWQPWVSPEETAVTPSPSTSSSSPSGNTIDLNQTVSGEIVGSGWQEWTYIGEKQEVDIRVEGGPNDTFVLILTYPGGGEAAYVDYSGRGEDALLKFYPLEENTKITVDETENDGADYTLSIIPSEPEYLFPGERYGGTILGANPEIFLYDQGPATVDIILEMSNAGQPLLEIYNPDDTLLFTVNQLDENGRLARTNFEFTEEGQYKIIIRDQANDGAVYDIEMNAIDEEVSEAETAVPEARTRSTDGMEMVYVQAGSFMMGSDPTEPDVEGDEFPKHTVFLDAFWIDKTEVTNSQFAYFLTQEGNQTENNVVWLAENTSDAQISFIDSIFRADLGYANYPVIEVTWYGANAYCNWVGGSLPTEAQWEYAARGPSRVVYPWGDTFDGSLVNYCDVNCEFDYRDSLQDDQYGITAPAGSYVDGKSWVGALNMAGNVWEWTADWYGSYPDGDQTNPTGPDRNADGWKIIRGGSWNSTPLFLRTANRYPSITQDYHDNTIGFRCVVPVE